MKDTFWNLAAFCVALREKQKQRANLKRKAARKQAELRKATRAERAIAEPVERWESEGGSYV